MLITISDAPFIQALYHAKINSNKNIAVGQIEIRSDLTVLVAW